MENAAVHRLVEQHAATRGDAPAILCGGEAVSYRDLNFRANAIARHVIAAGFRRGGHAIVTMAPGVDLAATLLGVLKAGGAYTWVPSGPGVAALALAPTHDEDASRYRTVDLRPVLAQPVRPGANLPILARATDLACVLPQAGGCPLLVPHSTIAAISRDGVVGEQPWEGDPTTFDLWSGLIGGATLSVEAAPALRNAA